MQETVNRSMRNRRGSAGRRGAAMVLLGVILLCGCGCSTDEPVAHPVVGIWGAATQSGELVPAFEFERDGACRVVDPSGTGLPATAGEYVELDESRVRCTLPTSSGEVVVIFEVAGDQLTVRVTAQEYSGFERMETD